MVAECVCERLKANQVNGATYKGVNLHQQAVGTFYQENKRLTEWVNQQPLTLPLVCLGDGHDGILNIYREIATPEGRREILDWYHLVENLGKVGSSQRRYRTY